MSDINGFRQYALTMIQDGYLDVGEERACMMQANEYGLSGPDAQAILFELCEEHGAKLERLLREEFAELVTDAVDDLFLDDGEVAHLHQQGAELFEGADEPMEEAKKIIEKVLAKTGAYTESLLIERVVKRLQPHVATGSTISKTDWQQIYQSEYDQVESRGVDCDENDIGEVLEKALEQAGLKVGEPPKKSGGGFGRFLVFLIILGLGGYYVLMDEEETTSTSTRMDSTQKVPSSNGESNPPKTVPSEAKTQTPTRMKSCESIAAPGSIPGKMKAQIRKALKFKCFRTPEPQCNNTTADKLLQELDAVCAPFLDATPRCQRQYENEHDAWGHCTAPIIENARDEMCGSYLKWANQDRQYNRTKACTWVRRCMRVQPGNERARGLKRELGCR